MNDNTRSNLRENWLFLIEHASSEKLQNKWIDPSNQNPSYSLSELVCMYFDDQPFDGSLSYLLENGVITKEEYSFASDFDSAFRDFVKNNYDYKKEESEVLKDKNWIKIRNLAKELFSKLQ